MKKLLSIVLVVAMMMSLIVVALPVSAADVTTLTPSTEADATMPTGSTGTTSAIPAADDFDYEAVYPAADGWISVSTLDELKAMKYGNKYYLKNDIEITGVEGTIVSAWGGADITLAGNGHTLTWKDSTASIFSGGIKALNVYDLNLAGTITVSANGENIGPLIKHGYAGSVTITNVHSTVNIVFSETATEIKNAVGGILAKSEGTNVWNNVSYTGSITVNANQTQTYCEGIGGIAGGVMGTLNATDVTVDATISANGSGNMFVGGIVGKISKDSTITNATVNADITVAGEGDKAIGGAVGKALANLTLENILIGGTITHKAVEANKVGGAVGVVGATLTVTDCMPSNVLNVTGNAAAVTGKIYAEAAEVIGATENPPAENPPAENPPAENPPVEDEPILPPSGATSATPVPDDFDYEAAYPEADGWIAVSDLDGLKAMANNGGKYYLTNDITVTGSGFNNWRDATIELAGNGHTLIWKDSDASIFGGGGGSSKITVYDLNLAGTMLITAERTENIGPLLKHGYAGGVTMTNVHSTVNIVFSETATEIRNAVGGILAKSEGTNVWNNVSYTGSITVNANQTQTYCEGIGGIAGGVMGTLNATDVTVDATISANGSGNMFVGGVVGKVGGDAVITNATVNVDITVGGEGDKAIGGAVGKALANLTLANILIDGTITNEAVEANKVGGAVGVVGATLTVTDCVPSNVLNVTGNAAAVTGKIYAEAAEVIGATENPPVDIPPVEDIPPIEIPPVEDIPPIDFTPTVEVKDPAELEKLGYIAIRTEEELKSLSSGKKYYLANDITLTSGRGGNFTDGELNGNGHTVTFAGGYSIINWGKNITVENLYLTGDVVIDEGSEYLSKENSNFNYGPLSIHGFDITSTIINCHSSVNITVDKSTIHGSIGGVIGKSHASDAIWINVSYTGTMNIGNGAMTQDIDDMRTIGGIAGMSGANLMANNIFVNATINCDAANVAGIGGLFGRTRPGNNTLTNCQFSGRINFGGICEPDCGIGGIVGYAMGSTLSASGLINNGNIIANSPENMAPVGGIFGHVNANEFSMSLNKVVNNGYIKGTKTAGGVIGEFISGEELAEDNPCIKITAVKNAGTVVAPYAAGGIIGKINHLIPDFLVEFKDIANTANIYATAITSSDGYDGAEGAGAMIGVMPYAYDVDSVYSFVVANTFSTGVVSGENSTPLMRMPIEWILGDTMNNYYCQDVTMEHFGEKLDKASIEAMIAEIDFGWNQDDSWGDTYALIVALESLKNEKETDYTPETWKAALEAIEAGRAFLSDATQEEVDAAVKAINDAIAALELKPIDKTALYTLVEQAKEIAANKDNYAVWSWHYFEQAYSLVDSAEEVDAISKHSELDRIYMNLRAGMSDLVDISELRVAVTLLDDKDKAYYSSYSWDNAVSAINEANELLRMLEAGERYYQYDVDVAVYNIHTYIEKLEPFAIPSIGENGNWWVGDKDTGIPAQGDKGDTGAQGDKGENGADGADGREIELRVEGGYIQWHYVGEATWKNLIALGDLKGDKGDTGAQGPQGEKGDKGDTGATGAQGPQGEKGDKGDKGDTGAAGAQGPQGEKGDKGDIGATGDDGSDGRQVEFRIKDGYIQWRYIGDETWNALIEAEVSKDETESPDLQRPQGNAGATGLQGETNSTGTSCKSSISASVAVLATVVVIGAGISFKKKEN